MNHLPFRHQIRTKVEYGGNTKILRVLPLCYDTDTALGTAANDRVRLGDWLTRLYTHIQLSPQDPSPTSPLTVRMASNENQPEYLQLLVWFEPCIEVVPHDVR